jgi:site-specific DNA-methyltransferase (adenine-specific)
MIKEQFGKITAYNADNISIMRQYPDNFFDLAIEDPPYGINAPNMTMGAHKGYESTAQIAKKKGRLNSGGGKLKNRALNNSSAEWDIPPTQEYFKELFRISKNQIIWGGNYFDLPPTRGMICWDKVQPWENFSQFELAWTSFDKPAKMYRLSTTGGNNQEKKIHPTQKPVKLYKWLLRDYAKEGFKILDSHGGSFASAIACHDLDFELAIIEKNTDYYSDGTLRLSFHQRQTRLFVGEELENDSTCQQTSFLE